LRLIGMNAPLFYRIAPFDTSTSQLRPMLVLLHGRGSDENDLLGLASVLDPRFVIVSVRAPRQFSYGGYTWYDLFEIGQPNMEHLVESHRLLGETITQIKEQLPVQKERIHLLGFSMGAMMSFAYALTNPQEVRAVVAHSGYIPEHTPLEYRWDALGSTSFFVAHGTEDPVVPVSMGRRSHELLSTTHALVTYREYPIPHTISDESLQDVCHWLQNEIS
jgi:phospholipase/carboxylesterase